jgi:hypothetical protein
VFRLLVLILGMLTANRPRHPDPALQPAGVSRGTADPRVVPEHVGADHMGRRAGARAARHLPPALRTDPDAAGNGGARLGARGHPFADSDIGPQGPDGQYGRSARRRRIPPRVKWAAAIIAVGLIFRRAIASVVMIALSAALHFVGINVHLPSIKFGWPWQTTSARTATNTDLGPWVLQKIEGISKPALGEANFSFYFTHKVSKNIGPWPCWYASTFYAVGRASATVDLNPGPSWWAPATGHYRLRVLSRPGGGTPGHVTVVMVLPRPQLPQSVHDVTIDNVPSKPIDTQHSWTYPGFGCGVVLRPQFPASVLYSQAQQIAFRRATHVPRVTRPLVSSAETQAAHTIRYNFIQPTVNSLGYTLDRFTIRWAEIP